MKQERTAMMKKLILLLLGLSCCGVSMSGEDEKTATSVKVNEDATPAKNPVADSDNFFADPSLEMQRGRANNGKVYFNFVGKYGYDDSGNYARTGKAAVLLSGRGKNSLIMGTQSIIRPGTTYILAGWFKGAEKASAVILRINWMKNDEFIKTELFTGNVGADTYRQITLKATAPEKTTRAVLYFLADNAWIDDLSFAPNPAASAKQ